MDDFLRKYKEYKTVLSVNALIWSVGKVLLLKRADTKKIDPGLYAGIGGKVEPGESFYEAILREVEEETGITKFESIRPFAVAQHPYPPTDSEWVNVYFVVNLANQVEIKPTEDGEFFWIDPRDIDPLSMPTDIKECIKILFKNPQAFVLSQIKHDDKGEIIEKDFKEF